MKNILLLLTAMLFTCTSVFAVPVMIQNLSTGNSVISGGYDVEIYLGVRPPTPSCNYDQIISLGLTPGQTVIFDGQTAMAGTCLQDFFWGISCSDPTFDQYFPGMRFLIKQGTFPGAQPVPSTEHIAGVTTELQCHSNHEWLESFPDPILGPNWIIQNPSAITTQLTFIDLGFMHQYIFN